MTAGRPGENDTLTAVPGVRVGHWSDLEALTGVTVMVFPEPNVAALEVRGAAPGTRETALLAPGMRVETIQALTFAGGSAFGLAAADGVVAGLEADGRGHSTPAGPVPIVPAAIVFDLLVGDPSVRPGRQQGLAAYRAAASGPVEQGCVGAGTGTVVAGWRGPGAVRKGGVGSAAVLLDPSDPSAGVVGALAVVNAVGDVFTLEGESLTGGAPAAVSRPVGPHSPREQTTLAAVVTNVRLTRNDLLRLAVRGQDAFAVCLRPGHTRYDGDAVFSVSCGAVAGDPDVAGEAAFVAVGRAVERAVRSAVTLGGVPAIGEES